MFSYCKDMPNMFNALVIVHAHWCAMNCSVMCLFHLVWQIGLIYLNITIEQKTPSISTLKFWTIALRKDWKERIHIGMHRQKLIFQKLYYSGQLLMQTTGQLLMYYNRSRLLGSYGLICDRSSSVGRLGIEIVSVMSQLPSIIGHQDMNHQTI